MTGAPRSLLDVRTYHLPLLLFLWLPIQILIQRSYTLRFLSSNPRDKYHFFLRLGTRQFVTESVITGLWTLLWLVYINLPFRSGLDGVLQGLKAGRGSNAGKTSSSVPNIAEPRSIASRALFSHLVAFTLKHYRKPFEVADVPALREDYTPAAALADWRVALAQGDRAGRKGGEAIEDSRRSTDRSGAPARPMRNLAGKLLWHFRTDFLLQACWVTSSTVFSFFPPVFLRSLLQYVAARKSGDLEAAPLHIGVLYVTLMVGGQILNAVSYSQTLNIGRRVCIKSRAIIIAELFAKALRRRDLSANVNDAKSSAGAKDGEDESAEAADAPSTDDKKEDELPEANISALVGVDSFYVSEISGESSQAYIRIFELMSRTARLPVLLFVVLACRHCRHGSARPSARCVAI